MIHERSWVVSSLSHRHSTKGETMANTTEDVRQWVSDQDYAAFRCGYVDAMLWANAYGAGGESEDVSYQYRGPGHWWMYTPVDLTDADDFLRANHNMLLACSDDFDRHGCDFALTRNHHGLGFWDRGYGDAGKALTRAAHAYGEAFVWLDEDDNDNNDEED
jgi:hypothetical protein